MESRQRTKQTEPYRLRLFLLPVYLPTDLPSISSATVTAAVATPIAAASAVTTSVATPATGPAAAGFALVFLARLFSGPAFEHSLAREPDLALRIDIGHHHGDLIAHVYHVFDF